MASSLVKALGLAFGLIGPLLYSPTAAVAVVTRRQGAPKPPPGEWGLTEQTSNPYRLESWYQAPFKIPETGIEDPEKFIRTVIPGSYLITLVPFYDIEDHVAFVGEDELKPHMAVGGGLNVDDVFYLYSVNNVGTDLLEKIRSDRGVNNVWWLNDGGPPLPEHEGPFTKVEDDGTE